MNPLKALIRNRLDAFEREHDYDMGYAREILEISTAALLRFNGVMGLAQYREDVPREAWYAAKLVGTLAEDCGPCTQLVVRMAEGDGVAPATIRAMLRGQEAAMPPDAALGWRFARAVLAHDLEADVLRREVVRRWGRRALVSLAYALTSARMFPTLKYALGHGHSCVRVRVGGEELPVAAA
ncbi:MAG TPA: hypothetical protein VFA75_17895 [Nevskia sp.]|nr:hypothetical protein [Nevskia sp.]